MSEIKTYTKINPTSKQIEFLHKLLNDKEISKLDYSYIINFVNSIVYNHNSWIKKNS
jgi:hypothetical protein